MHSSAVLGILLPVLFAATAAVAGPSFEPRRQLSEAERLEYSVAESEVVGIGTVRGVVDALVPVATADRFETYRYFIFRPDQWLKGSLPFEPIAVGFDDERSLVFARIRGWTAGDSVHVLVFLRSRPGAAAAAAPPPPEPARRERKGRAKVAVAEAVAAPASYPVGPAGLARCDWIVDESPYLYAGGVATLREGDAEAVERTLEAAARSRSLESLVVDASLAVLGTAIGETPCPVGGSESRCARVRIDQMLAGSTIAAEIPVYSLLPDGVPAGQSLYFVKQTPAGPYEILAWSAGVMPVRDGRVEPLGKRLEDVQAGILKIVREKRGPGD